MRNRVHFVPLLLMAGLAAACQASDHRARASRDAGADVRLAREADVVEARVPARATMVSLLQRHGVPVDTAESLVGAVRSVFDPRKLREAQAYRVTRTLDGLLREFRYDIDADRFLRVVFQGAVPAGVPAFEVAVVPYPKEIVEDAVGADISSSTPSLVAALEAEGENIQLALDLADAFGGLVDFNSDLQVGDRIEASFERTMRDGAFVGYERLQAAVLNNDGRRLTAIPFAPVGGQRGWYDEQGRSLKRPFLKSPLPFQTTISSGFSYRRLHPVHGTFRAHPAIDYRAPYGARVVSVAAGTVVSAAFSGAAGRMVKIRHAGGYESMYLHLSAFAPGIHPGAKVAQGDTIGRVGNSGVVTGTHLDYRLTRNGAYVHPIREHSRMPAGEPISAAELPSFYAERDRALTALQQRMSTSALVTRRPN